ncbi:MAG: S8 family serine peptidase, partial [Balneolaceae bacterium]|nr:S8 family serine peptidase [Balneolaceae bacterium]
LDNNPGYPSPYYGSGRSGASASLWLTVGASSWKPGEEFVASFSNYGSKTVDLFAPGVDIYSTMPGNNYEFEDGTSMASPVVAGIAALVMAHYPDMSPRQVRDLIFDNTIKYGEQRVILPNEQGTSEPLVRFDTLSASGGLVNVYRVLQAAETMRD